MLKKEINTSTPKFSVGDIVRVRLKEEILQGLDPFNKLEGCLFMNEMWAYCGKKFKVIKLVNNFFDEYRYKMYKTRSHLYILDGLLCNGIVEIFDHTCDRSCYLLWHEEWFEGIASNLTV